MNISTPAPNTPSAQSGVQMGNMGEGGGSFYMGDEGQEEEQEEQDLGHPQLVVENQGKEDDRRQNRQYLEELITGNTDSHFSLYNPFSMPATQRSFSSRCNERSEMRIRPAGEKGHRMFIINA